ncbi:MAG TPA: SDR family oxidoreductase [bacterium]|jgi:NAD(P)-dependent dehydrogenase (short-subunit alcohol dehydrogenase family)|nr:SDR family oxidoreductase [bacterium]
MRQKSPLPGPVRAYVVSGGARGIGRAIAEQLALREGARVAILDSDHVQGAAAAKRLGPGSCFLLCDLARPAQIKAAASALKAFPKLDGLVNNAGIGAFKPLERLSLADWDRVQAVNLRAPFFLTQQLLPRLKPGASVVNIASTRALMSEPGGEAYGASKGGLVALTHALALSLQARHLRVNAVLPGWIDVSALQGKPSRLKLRTVDHAQHPAGRVGRPEDVAAAVSYLLDGTRSGFVTGQQLVVDGGMTVKMQYVPD